MISSSVSTSAISSYLVYADADSNEIKEATAASYINTKSAAHFDESYTANSGKYNRYTFFGDENVTHVSDLINECCIIANMLAVSYKVPGIVSMNSGTWLVVALVFQGSTSSSADLRGYGALTHPNCKLSVKKQSIDAVSNLFNIAVHGIDHNVQSWLEWFNKLCVVQWFEAAEHHFGPDVAPVPHCH